MHLAILCCTCSVTCFQRKDYLVIYGVMQMSEVQQTLAVVCQAGYAAASYSQQVPSAPCQQAQCDVLAVTGCSFCATTCVLQSGSHVHHALSLWRARIAFMFPYFACTQPGCPHRRKHHLHKPETANNKSVTIWWILYLWTEDLLQYYISQPVHA